MIRSLLVSYPKIVFSSEVILQELMDKNVAAADPPQKDQIDGLVEKGGITGWDASFTAQQRSQNGVMDCLDAPVPEQGQQSLRLGAGEAQLLVTVEQRFKRPEKAEGQAGHGEIITLSWHGHIGVLLDAKWAEN